MGPKPEWPFPSHSTQTKLKGEIKLLHTGNGLIWLQAQAPEQDLKISTNKRKG